MLNQTVVEGWLMETPERKRTPGKVSVCAFTLACERDFRAAGAVAALDYIDCVAWREQAEQIGREYSAGDLIVVAGRIRAPMRTSRDGYTYKRSELIVARIFPVGEVTSLDQVLVSSGDAEFVEIEDGGKLPF